MSTRRECHLAALASRLLSAAMPIDLRSDTVTRPTPAMREAMARAPRRRRRLRRGRDRQRARAHGPPSCAAARRRCSCRRGRWPTRSAFALWAGQGDEVYAHVNSHMLIDEAGGTAALWGAHPRGLHSAGLRPRRRGAAATPCRWTRATSTARCARLLCIENTHTGSGGRVWSAEALARVTGRAHELGLRVHMDGARLPNAAVARGCTLAEASAGADSVSFCFSKGLGAPVGSILVSSGGGDRARAQVAQAARRRHAPGRRDRGRGALRARAQPRPAGRRPRPRARVRGRPGRLPARLGRPRGGGDEHRAGASAAGRAGARGWSTSWPPRACSAAPTTAVRCAS